MFYVEICHLHRMSRLLTRSCYFLSCIVKQMYQFILHEKYGAESKTNIPDYEFLLRKSII